MKKTTLIVFALCVGLLMAAAPLIAHHAFAAEYDNTKPLTMKGTFVKMDWVNPHSWVHFEVTLPNGTKQVWQGETPPPNQLIRQGWSRSELKVGDEIQVAGFAAKDGSTKMWASNVNIIARD